MMRASPGWMRREDAMRSEGPALIGEPQGMECRAGTSVTGSEWPAGHFCGGVMNCIRLPAGPKVMVAMWTGD